jgi:periplasmic protein CpxP/Spy
MSMRKLTLVAAVALGVVPALSAVIGETASAQSAAATAPAPPPHPSHIEGRLAFLRTELKITDAQLPQWNAFAAVMRQNDEARQERFRQRRAAGDKPMNAVERLEARERFSETQADNLKRTLAAFRPLYDVLSADQKQVADELFGRHDGPRRHGRF